MFANDSLNYAKYLPIYMSEMNGLPEQHPEAYASIASGSFGLQRDEKPFTQVPRDQAIEQTPNKATKTRGGIIGFSRNTRAVRKWIVTAHDRASVRQNCFSMAGLSHTHLGHTENSSTRLKKDEEDVVNVASIVSGLGNPFASSTDDLRSISSGVIATLKCLQVF